MPKHTHYNSKTVLHSSEINLLNSMNFIEFQTTQRKLKHLKCLVKQRNVTQSPCQVPSRHASDPGYLIVLIKD